MRMWRLQSTFTLQSLRTLSVSLTSASRVLPHSTSPIRLWEGYYLGAFGDYILDDMINANFTRCAESGGASGCIRTQSYELDVLGIGAVPPDETPEEQE